MHAHDGMANMLMCPCLSLGVVYTSEGQWEKAGIRPHHLLASLRMHGRCVFQRLQCGWRFRKLMTHEPTVIQLLFRRPGLRMLCKKQHYGMRLWFTTGVA